MIKEFKYKNKKVLYRAGTSDEEVIKHSFENDIFFNTVIEYFPFKTDVIIDVGAHIGTFSILGSEKASRGKVYAIEPCKETFDLLNRNVLENGIGNLFPFNIALAGEKGETKLFHDVENGNWGHSITKNISDNFETVNTNTLDNFFYEQKINKINFIKFNCEGAEFEILLNTLPQTLKKIDFFLILYHEDLVECKYSHLELLAMFKKINYKFKIINKTELPQRGWIVAYKNSFVMNFKVEFSIFIKKIQFKFKLIFNK